MKYKAYVGTYSTRGSKGIYLVEADAKTGALAILDSFPAVNPSYLATAERSRYGILFAALECDEFEGVYGGGAASYAIKPDGSLSLLSTMPTKGTSPCHVCPSPDGRQLYVSNYGDGTLSVFQVKDGILSEASLVAHSGHGPNEKRQSGPHVHSSQLEPGGGRLCVVDLGIDRAVFYNTADMSEAGVFAVEGGSGPRHVVFSESLPFAWLVCEMGNEVYAFERRSGRRTGIYSTLPNDFTGRSSSAAIKLSPDEKRLYVSNRGHNSIACFDIDRETGALSPPSIYPTGGKTPRDFAISPDNAFLYAAHQDSDNIRVFAIEKGALVDTGLSLDVPSPVCILINS